MSKTNKQTKKPWTDSHQKRYNSLFNYITDTLKLNYNKESYLTDHKKEIFKLIEISPIWKDGTKESYFFMVSRYLFNLNNNDKYVKIFSDAGFKLMVKTQENTGNNELDEKEIENYRPREFFMNITPVLIHFHVVISITSLLFINSILSSRSWSKSIIIASASIQTRISYKCKYFCNKSNLDHAKGLLVSTTVSSVM